MPAVDTSQGIAPEEPQEAVAQSVEQRNRRRIPFLLIGGSLALFGCCFFTILLVRAGRATSPLAQQPFVIETPDVLATSVMATVIALPTNAPTSLASPTDESITPPAEATSEPNPLSLPPLWGQTWYCAMGDTSDGFETWFAVDIIGNASANIDVSYYVDDDTNIERFFEEVTGRLRIGAHESAQVGANKVFGTRFRSDVPIAVERSVTFTLPDGSTGRHAASCAQSPVNRWLLPEGTTERGTRTLVVILNPSDVPANIVATFELGTGEMLTFEYLVDARKPFTLDTLELLGFDRSFSIDIASDVPIVVERVSYDARGGDAALGIPIPQP